MSLSAYSSSLYMLLYHAISNYVIPAPKTVGYSTPKSLARSLPQRPMRIPEKFVVMSYPDALVEVPS